MNYIIYCRKSSEAEDRQVMSIDSQEKELLILAQRNNFKIIKTFKENMSAKSPGRPIFEEMLSFIEKKKDCTLLVWKLDRLARNALDGGKISWFMDRKLIIEIRTPEKIFKNISDDMFMMSLDFGIAKKYIDDLSQNVKRGNRAKLSLGGWPNHAPKGYINNKADKTIIIDKKSAHYVIRIFELYSKGTYNLKEVADILYQEGFRSCSGKKIFKGHIHRIIKNPFYYGVMLRDGKYYEGKHEPLISKTLHDQANEVLNGKLHSKKQKLFFHLRGLLKCANCGCMLTASKKKGHDYYYCTNGKGECEEHKKYLRSEKIDEHIADIFSKLQFDEELIELTYRASKEKQTSESVYSEKNALIIEKRLTEVIEAQSRICNSFTAGNTPETLYNAKMTILTNEETALKKQIKEIRKMIGEGVDTLEPVKKLFLEANKARNDYILGDPLQKQIIANNLLWNLGFQGQKVLNLRLKMPYERMAQEPKPTELCEMLRG
ncbi:recombinase family protein [Patescibacteria group bacterium]|nr:recombinase family protein [Patescibacteria group bacterium]